LISLDLQPDDVLLDIGCGDARLSLIALRDFGIKEAIAIEWCKDWVDETKKFIKKKKWKLPKSLTYEANTYQDFDFPERVTKCVFMAHHNGQRTLDNVKEKLSMTECSIFVHNFGHQDSVLVEVI
jgi:cyclopropane fatty-acyl-phospholipid synthase-like methyltransferase